MQLDTVDCAEHAVLSGLVGVRAKDIALSVQQRQQTVEAREAGSSRSAEGVEQAVLGAAVGAEAQKSQAKLGLQQQCAETQKTTARDGRRLTTRSC
jgi:tRNA threonylcarbamoyladenosine modification (KEOPS) complex  Pcc1 subunit